MTSLSFSSSSSSLLTLLSLFDPPADRASLTTGGGEEPFGLTPLPFGITPLPFGITPLPLYIVSGLRCDRQNTAHVKTDNDPGHHAAELSAVENGSCVPSRKHSDCGLPVLGLFQDFVTLSLSRPKRDLLRKF